MNTRERTCADRIDSALENTEESLKEIFAVLNNESDSDKIEEAYTDLYEYALSVDPRQETIICLSWGGPASYIEVTHRGTEIYTITYRFSDWFDTATKEVTDEDSAIWKYAQELIDIQEAGK